MQVAVGTDCGTVCVYDISTSRLRAVQRFAAYGVPDPLADATPVSCLAARGSPRHMAAAATAGAPRGLDGGGVLRGPGGLPWREPAPEREGA